MTTTPEKQQRKHAELIHAWADGATIEFKVREGVWATIRTPLWEDDVEYRLQPAPPAKVYPTCDMSVQQLAAEWDKIKDSGVGACLMRIGQFADAVLRHAIDNGQVVPMAECVELGRELSKRYHAKREIELMEAVRRNCLRYAANAHQCNAPKEIIELDLAAVISGVDAAQKIAVADGRPVHISFKADLSNLDVKAQS